MLGLPVTNADYRREAGVAGPTATQDLQRLRNDGWLDQEACTIECPRHGSLFDLKTGKPLTLPAYVPVDTFPVIIEEETIKLEVE